MPTIVNTLEKRSVSSTFINKSQQLFLKSILAGVLGYFIFLLTLAATYWLTDKLFSIGSKNITSVDWMISSIGFLILFTAYFNAGKKQISSEE